MKLAARVRACPLLPPPSLGTHPTVPFSHGLVAYEFNSPGSFHKRHTFKKTLQLLGSHPRVLDCSSSKQNPAAAFAMEIDVGGAEQTVMDNVETVEIVASGDDLPIPVSSTAGVGLMEQHMMVTNPESILVPTSEVRP